LLITRDKMQATLSPQTPRGDWPIRTITRADGAALNALMKAAFADTVDSALGTAEDEMRKTLADVDGHTFLSDCSFLIEDNEGISSACIIWWYSSWRTPMIADVMTHPRARRQGQSRFLVQTSMNALLAHGYKDLTLMMTQGNTPAQRLYQSLGFTVLRTWTLKVR
jgi:predicted GNAT family acetyltransferase